MATSVGQIGLDLVVNQKPFQAQMKGIQSLAKKQQQLWQLRLSQKIVDFGKSCLELGSDLAEVQNVVSVNISEHDRTGR